MCRFGLALHYFSLSLNTPKPEPWLSSYGILIPTFFHFLLNFQNSFAREQQVKITPDTSIVHSTAGTNWIRQFYWRLEMPNG